MNDKLRALYKGALQGSTMGLADEAIGGIGALYARAMAPELFQNDSFSNTYAQVRDLDRAENKQLEQNNPWTYGGANLAGGIAMPLGLAGQGLKGAVKAGGIAGGLTGYGMSEKTNPYALALDTVTGAGLGAGAGAALYGAGKVATNPQVQKFAKDYIADESGALKLLPDKIQTIKNEPILYHGTSSENRLGILREGFKPSAEMADDFVGGGGYGAKQTGISFSTNEDVAKNFALNHQYGAIIPTKIKQGTKIYNAPEIEYAEDLTKEMADELKSKGVGAIRIGSGEDEIVIIDKSAIKEILPNTPSSSAYWSKYKAIGRSLIE